MSAKISAEHIRPLIHEHSVSARRMNVQFKCPRTGTLVQARWSAPSTPSASGKFAAQAKRSAWMEVRRQLNNTLRSIFGRGMAGRMATNTLNSAVSGATRSRSGAAALSKSEREQGFIEAFKSVEAQFVWVDGGWVHASAVQALLPPFQAQLAAHPVEAAYDRRVLARILAEVAQAEGGIQDEERELIQSLLDEEQSLDSVLTNPPLTPAELAETQAGDSRVSMLAIAWSVALCDDDLAPEELRLLDRFADGLNLSQAQRDQAKTLGYDQILEQLLAHAFGSEGYDTEARTNLYAAAQRLGVDTPTIQRAEAQFRKRKGL